MKVRIIHDKFYLSVVAPLGKRTNPSHYYIDQLTNIANPNIHYETTGQEIIDALNHIDYFVCGIGSGGSITGIGRRIKESFPKAKVIGVQPKGCDVLKGKAIKHKIQGWATGVLPPVLDTSIIDDMYSVSYEESIALGKEIVVNEGLFLGISSCANLLAANALSKKVNPNKVIVTLAPDSGHIYLPHFISQTSNTI